MTHRAVLVHGAWHGAWAWAPLLPELRALGVEPETVELPSARGLGDLRDDAAGLAADRCDRLGEQSLRSFTQPLTGAAWREVPSTYVTCLDDRALPVEAQRAMAGSATAVVDLAGGPSPFATRPAELAAVVAAAAPTGAGPTSSAARSDRSSACTRNRTSCSPTRSPAGTAAPAAGTSPDRRSFPA